MPKSGCLRLFSGEGGKILCSHVALQEKWTSPRASCKRSGFRVRSNTPCILLLGPFACCRLRICPIIMEGDGLHFCFRNSPLGKVSNSGIFLFFSLLVLCDFVRCLFFVFRRACTCFQKKGIPVKHSYLHSVYRACTQQSMPPMWSIDRPSFSIPSAFLTFSFFFLQD